MNLRTLAIAAISLTIFSSCSLFKQTEQTTTAEQDTVTKTMDTVTIEGNRNYRASATRINDLKHTKLRVSFDWQNQYLYGQAAITLTPHFYPTDSLKLDAKGFNLDTVALMTDEGKKLLDYEYDSLNIHIDLPRTYTKDESYKVYVRYTAKPEQLPENKGGAISGDKGLYFIDPLNENPDKPRQLWTQGETEASSCWFPTIDKPNQRTSQEIYMTVADSFTTLSNGELVSSTEHDDGTRTDYWKQELDHPPYLFMMAVGKFEVVEDEQWRGKPVNYYMEPEYAPYAKDIFGNTPEMLTYFSDTLGIEYPWDKYSQVVVRDFVAGAMENTSASVFYSALNSTSREMIDNNHDDIIAHELIHQWFGDIVTCESWSNLTLNEAFASYGEYLWREHHYGRQKADDHLKGQLSTYLREAGNKKRKMINFYYDHREDMFDAHSYQKGSRVLHMLRKTVGDKAFFASLERYLDDNKYEPVEIHDLRLAFEEVTGRDMNWFFNQWFLDAGHPVLEIDYAYNDSLNRSMVYIEQKQEEPAPSVYKLPVQVDVYKNDEVNRHSVTIDQREDTLVFEASQKPNLVNVDAQKKLLAAIIDNKTTDQYYYQYNNAPLFLDRHNAVEHFVNNQSSKEKAERGLVAAINDDYSAIREKAIEGISRNNENEDQVISHVLKRAKHDESSSVRATAIDKLDDFELDSLAYVYKRGLNDSSYQVMAASLKALNIIAPEEAEKESAKLEDKSNRSIVSAVASVYAENETPGKLAYFQDQMRKLSGISKYSLINQYKKYLPSLEMAEIEVALPGLKKVADENDAWFIRYIAAQSIMKVETKYSDEKSNLEDDLAELEKKENPDKGEMEKLKADIDKISSFLDKIEQIKSDLAEDETNQRLKRLYQ